MIKHSIFNTIRKSGLVPALSLVLLLGVSAFCKADFQSRTIADQLEANKQESAIRMVFFGTSSFLIDDGITQVLVDGFFTRRKHRFFGKVSPSEIQIMEAISNFRICKAPHLQETDGTSSSCENGNGKGLEYIIPTHGHYDHALDAPYLAAWSGSKLIGDQTVQAILEASKEYSELTLPQAQWDRVNPEKPFKNKRQKLKVLNAGAFTITLIRTKHNRNLSSGVLSGSYTKPFSFPARLWDMQQGSAYSVLIEHSDRRVLIVPSAGAIGNTLRDLEVSAEVVFLASVASDLS